MNKLRKLILEALDPPKKIGCSCGCNTCDKAPILNESKKYDYAISVNMRYHIDTKTPIHDSILPKPEYNKLINEAKVLVKKDIIKLQGEDLKLIKEDEDGKWQVIWHDIDGDDTIDEKIFNSKQEADKYADSFEYDYQDIEINKDGEDEWKTFYRFFNPKDRHMPYYGYRVEPILNINESSFEKLYKIEGLLVTNKQVLTQSQVLSDIRAVSGVTIVSNKEYNPQSPKKNYEYNYTTVKIDPSPYIKLNGKFDIEDVKGIIEKINNLKGVVKYKAEPKLINIGI